MPATGPPPLGGDVNMAATVHAFTWPLVIVSLTFVIGRMYSRIKLTRNVWWDDWCICAALVLDFVVSIMWSVYAGRGYARHLYYLTPKQLSNALELNTISRSLCMLSIAIGKISVAFLIKRIAAPSNWRKWLLRVISVSLAISASITFLLFYLQCQPTRALWDKQMIQEGTGKCLNPVPVNIWDLVIASYWTLLDFALAAIPVDIVWKLQLSLRNRLLLSVLLMPVHVRQSRPPKYQLQLTRPKTLPGRATIALLMWNGIEMNVIIIAACIPTLRPVYLVLFNRPGANQFRANASPPHYTSYIRSSDSSAARMNHKSTSSNQAFQELASNASTRSINVGKDGVVAEDSVQIENREGGGREEGEGQWGHRIGTWVALSEVRRDAER